MTSFMPMRSIAQPPGYKKGDVMVIFGELFNRGYANGIVEAAEKLGMSVIYGTVGRRDPDGNLRALNAEELAQKPHTTINFPLEAGFDFEPANDGTTPCDQISKVKMSEWLSAKLNWEQVEQSRQSATKRFRTNVSLFMNELALKIPPTANILFVHTMAGGVPRAKILMPVMNRVFKGRGDRFQESETFWQSELGKLCDLNFNEVTADTFKYLVEESSAIREQATKNGRKVSYVAYGYHGTEVLINGEYRWQSYSPYVQGWAKKRLEDHAVAYSKKGIACTVYNCPEILTNSSSIFLGVEVCLYPLLSAYKKEGTDHPLIKQKFSELQKLLKPEISLEQMLERCNSFISNPVITNSYDLKTWPQHNTKEQMEVLLEASSQLIDMHQDTKDLITFRLSEDVFKASGALMLADAWSAKQPVWWLGHDIIAKQILS